MKKYQPVPLPKHWLTSKSDNKAFEFSNESLVGMLLGPLSLIYLNVWLALGLAFLDMIAFVLIHFIVSQKFFSIVLIAVAIVLLIANHYLCAWLRNWLLERGK